MKLLATFTITAILAAIPLSTTAKPQDPLDTAPNCLETCAPGDVDCRAACTTDLTSDSERAIKTFECAVACPQGNGSAEASDEFSNCIDGCVQLYFLAETNSTSPTQVSPGSIWPYLNISSQTSPIASELEPTTMGSNFSAYPAQTSHAFNQTKHSSAVVKSSTNAGSPAVRSSTGAGALHTSISQNTPFVLWFATSLFLIRWN